MNNRIVTSFCVSCAVLCAVQSTSAQGSLTPPGAPAPTMLTLSQAEPRTPITNTTAVTISSPGSYYLTANISVTSGSAIIITASQVTLDLNGFTLSSTEASPTGTGILLAGGNADITIRNGHIAGGVTYSSGNYTGPGFANGIYYSGSTPENVLVSHVSVSGCLDYGIFLNINNSTVVEFCAAQTIGSYGIDASTVSHSTAYQCGSVAIFADIASDGYASSTGNYGLSTYNANNCFGICIGSGSGLSAYNANNCVGNCTGTGSGLSAYNANNCVGNCAGSGYGLNASQTATGCYGVSATGTGLNATTANNCQGQSGGGGTGLDAAQTATGCFGSSVNGGGLSANVASNCIGESTGHGMSGSPGLFALCANNCYGETYGNGGGLEVNIAIGCIGQCPNSEGFGLSANIANSCYSTSGDGNIVNPYNMP